MTACIVAPSGEIASVTLTYNVSDQPTEVGYTALGTSWDVTNTYAKTKQLVTRTAAGNTWDFSFADQGRLSSIRSPLGLQTRSFDVYGRLEAVREGNYDGSDYVATLASVLSYDPLGRIASQAVDGGIDLYDFTDTFNYDDANRLTGWQRTGTGATTASYTYDAACNITTATVSGVTTGYTYDADNRLTASVTGTQTTTYTNDLYGRRTSVTRGQQSASYTWDALGHLTSVVSEDATITYAYGITGMREYKSVEASGAPVAWTKSVYDGQQLAAELDSDGTRYTYVWGPDRTPLALKVSSGASSVTYAYHTDALGNVVAITSPTGGVVASYRYDPYGRVTHVGGSDLALAERNPIRYRSYYHDAETGFCYLPARYYDPDTMRFLSADPAAPSAGDPLTLNAFVYCLGDPVNLVDTDGREPHGFNMPDGYGEDGYNYGHDDTKSTMPDAQAEANRIVAQMTAPYVGPKVITPESSNWDSFFSQPDPFTLALDAVSAGADVVWFLGLAFAGAGAGECLTPAVFSGVPEAQLGVGGVMMATASIAGSLADAVGLGWSLYQYGRGKAKPGDVGISLLELAWYPPGSGTVKFWVADPWLWEHGTPMH